MKLLLRYLKPYAPKMCFNISVKTLGTLVELALPYILSYILKSVVVTQSVSQIVFWGLMMVLCAAFGRFCNVFANRKAARVSRDFSENLRRDLFAKTLRLSAAQTDRFTIPSLESRITTDTYNVHHFVGMMQRMGIRAPILLIGGIIITLVMDRFLALGMLALLPFIFVTVYFISRRGVPLYTKVQQAVDRMVRVVREDSMGIRVIKALSKTEYEHKRYDNVNKSLSDDEKKAGIIMGTVNPIMTFLMNAGIVAVIALSSNRVQQGLSDPETVVAFMQYFTMISMAMMSVSRIFVMYTKSSASARRIAEVLETEEELLVESIDKYPPVETDYHILFDNVSFSYLGKKNNIENISFGVKKGGSVGIIGATGSGKSTIVKLLLRFYDVGKGNIYIDGRDIRTIPKKELYAMFGTAMQFDFLVGDTIEENIRFGRDISNDDIVKAAVIAQANDFIKAFPDGYSHVLSQKGTNISGGQKQRILISRAIAANPDILILDDSSSALDYKTDANLRSALAREMKESTLVTVAQRVSSVKDCDVILVIDEGEIIGIGDHEHLLNNCTEYREISDSQMGGAFVE